MEITTKDIRFCAACNNYRGTVEEKYNGTVPVLCACDMEAEGIKYGRFRSPCMICPNGTKFWWIPTSDHKKSDGKWWHTPHFAGPFPNSATWINKNT